MKITKEELAARITGRQYGEELTPEENDLANQNGLVVVYGASDDLCEFEGAIYDEIGCYDGGTVFVNKKGIANMTEEEEEVLHKYNVLDQIKDQNKQIDIIWNANGYSWSYETAIPHVTFEIFDENEPYCLGVIFSLSDL